MTADVVIDEVSPAEAYEILATTEGSALIDVRTSVEWDQVGVPSITETGRPLWFAEWVRGPERAPNPAFLQQVIDQAGGTLPQQMLFICRSGARSAAAARAVAGLAHELGQSVRCTNVAEGFEGSPAHGEDSGWQRRSLPWRVQADS